MTPSESASVFYLLASSSTSFRLSWGPVVQKTVRFFCFFYPCIFSSTNKLQILKPWKKTVKKGNITPIFRKRRKEGPGCNRLMSFVTVLRKIMQQILLEDILRYMGDEHVIPDNKHIFTKRRWCQHSSLLWWSESFSGQRKGN